MILRPVFTIFSILINKINMISRVMQEDNRPASSSSTPSSIDWSDTVKKEARGTDDSDFGEVQEVGQNYVVTQKGLVDRQKFYIPKYMVQGYDGDTLWFNATEAEIDQFKRDSPPQYDEYTRFKREDMPADIETRIPLIEERLDVSKRVNTGEVTIAKEPVTETKTVEVPVTHEEVRIERRPSTTSSSTAISEGERPVESRSEIRVPVTSEEVEVTKRPYVKEEVVVTKEPVTETKTVTDTVRSERVDTEAKRSTATDASLKGTQIAEDTVRDIKEGAADAADKAKSAFDKAKEKVKDALK